MMRNKFLSIGRTYALGDRPIDGLKLVGYQIITAVLARLHSLHHFQITVRIRCNNRTARMSLGGSSDWAICREIFLNRSYEIPLKRPSASILDLGSNIGLSIVWFKLQYPDARIIGFEPNPEIQDLLQRNVSQFTDVAIYPQAVAGIHEDREFYLMRQSKGSSLFPRDRAQQTVRITCLTLDEVLDHYFPDQTIDLLKFDIEGAEFEMLTSFQQKNRVANWIGELHNELATEEQRAMIAHYFDRYHVTIRYPEAAKSHLIALEQ